MSRALTPPAVARCTPRPPASRYLHLFADNASPEAIQEHIKARTAELGNLQKHIAWLEELAAMREQQIAAGVWPPPA